MSDLASLPHADERARSTVAHPSGLGRGEFTGLTELGVSYRQLDYWCRNGMIALSTPAEGSGSRRVVTPLEVEAIKALVDEFAAVERRMRFLRSGDFFEAKMNELNRRHDAELNGPL